MQGNEIQQSVLKPLLKYIYDPAVQEINIHRPKEIDLIMRDDIRKTISDDNLTATALKDFLIIFSVVTGKRYSRNNSVMSFALFGEHRVSVIGGEFTKNDFLISIRPKRNEKIGLENFGLTNKEILELKSAVENRKNILILGATRQGKTTFLNGLMKFIPDGSRVFTIENVEEVELPERVRHLNIFYQERNSSSQIQSLIDAILRHSPDRIIFGELRIDNSIHFTACLKKGHAGTIATIHANDADTVFSTLKQNIGYQTTGGNASISDSSYNSFTEDIEEMIDIAVLIKRVENNKGETEIKAHITHYNN